MGGISPYQGLCDDNTNCPRNLGQHDICGNVWHLVKIGDDDGCGNMGHGRGCLGGHVVTGMWLSVTVFLVGILAAGGLWWIYWWLDEEDGE